MKTLKFSIGDKVRVEKEVKGKHGNVRYVASGFIHRVSPSPDWDYEVVYDTPMQIGIYKFTKTYCNEEEIKSAPLERKSAPKLEYQKSLLSLLSEENDLVNEYNRAVRADRNTIALFGNEDHADCVAKLSSAIQNKRKEIARFLVITEV